MRSSGYVFYSGNSGGFGITSTSPYDSVTISMDGYQKTVVRIESSHYEYVTLKMLQSTGNAQKKHLISSVGGLSNK